MPFVETKSFHHQIMTIVRYLRFIVEVTYNGHRCIYIQHISSIRKKYTFILNQQNTHSFRNILSQTNNFPLLALLLYLKL